MKALPPLQPDQLPLDELNIASVHYHRELTSTNQWLLSYLADHPTATGYQLAIAEGQTAGRGQHGRTWFSPSGLNLYFTLGINQIITDPVTAGVPFSAIIAGIACARVLQQMLAPVSEQKIGLKWPNDIMVGRKKLAGILIENQYLSGRVQRSVLGVGINVALSLQASSADALIDQPWTDLLSLIPSAEIDHFAAIVDRQQLLQQCLQVLLSLTHQFQRHGLQPFLQEWNRWHIDHEQAIQLLVGDDRMEGVVQGLDTKGALLLKGADDVVRGFLSGQVVKH